MKKEDAEKLAEKHGHSTDRAALCRLNVELESYIKGHDKGENNGEVFKVTITLGKEQLVQSFNNKHHRKFSESTGYYKTLEESDDE